MSVIISKNSEEKANMAQIETQFLDFKPIFDKQSAHVQDVLLDNQISKVYKKDFSIDCSEIKKIVCQCR